MEKLLTNREIAKLNAARDVLNDLIRRAQTGAWKADAHEAYALGKLNEIAENAEHLVFQVLNTGKAYAGLKITDEQMHNRKDEAVAA